MVSGLMRIVACPQADDLYAPALVETLLETADAVIIQRFWGDLGRYSRFGKRVLVDVRPKFSYGWRIIGGRWDGWHYWQIVAAEALDAGMGLYPYSVEQPKKRDRVSE